MPTVVSSLGEGLDIGMSEGSVLALFWAPWCHPCRLQKPIIDALATTYVGRVHFLEINIDKRPEVANRFGVQSIPTMILFKSRTEVKRFIGFQEKVSLSTTLNSFL